MLVGGCREPVAEEPQQDPHEALIGAWEFLYSESIFPDTVLRVDSNDLHSIYLINRDHFNFITTSRDRKQLLYAGFGRYSLNESGTEYIEHIEYHSTPDAVGMAVRFENKVEGDIWTHSGYIPIDKNDESLLRLTKGDDKYQLIEVRRRMK